MSLSSQLALGNSYLVAASSHGIVSVWEKVTWTNAISWRMAILSQSHLNGCKWWDEGNFQRKTYFAGELAPSLQRPVSSGFLPSGQCWSGLSVKNAIIAFIIFHNLFGQGFFFRCLFRHWVISRRSNLGVGGDGHWSSIVTRSNIFVESGTYISFEEQGWRASWNHDPFSPTTVPRPCSRRKYREWNAKVRGGGVQRQCTRVDPQHQVLRGFDESFLLGRGWNCLASFDSVVKVLHLDFDGSRVLAASKNKIKFWSKADRWDDVSMSCCSCGFHLV